MEWIWNEVLAFKQQTILVRGLFAAYIGDVKQQLHYTELEFVLYIGIGR